MADDVRTAKAKADQDYEASPPRCITCVYFRREPHAFFRLVEKRTRKGKTKLVKVRVRPHPLSNPIVDRCSFGNFLTRPNAICNEWRTRDGERLDIPEDAG